MLAGKGRTQQGNERQHGLSWNEHVCCHVLVQALPSTVCINDVKWRVELKKNKTTQLVILRKAKAQKLQVALSNAGSVRFMLGLLEKLKQAEITEEALPAEKMDFMAVIALARLWNLAS